MEHSVASAMANLITLITESDPEGAYYDMLDYDTVDEVKNWFYGNGLTWGEVVEIDVKRILNELEPLNFIS